jgi:hypothetical protein
MRETTWIIYAQSGALTVEGLQRTELAPPATDPLENKKKVGRRARIGARALRAVMATHRWSASCLQSLIREAK